MDKAVLYIHGQGGNAEEAWHYKPLFESCDVIGLTYTSQSPWEAKEEFPRLFDSLCEKYQSVILIANSIGAFYAMNAFAEKKIEKAFFISPVVDMQRLIEDIMAWENISETELKDKGSIETAFRLSWEYLCYVREHPINWNIPTHILYGEKDTLTSIATISKFAEEIGATLTVMENGEHWFHTEAQMNFLDTWIRALQG